MLLNTHFVSLRQAIGRAGDSFLWILPPTGHVSDVEVATKIYHTALQILICTLGPILEENEYGR